MMDELRSTADRLRFPRTLTKRVWFIRVPVDGQLVIAFCDLWLGLWRKLDFYGTLLDAPA